MCRKEFLAIAKDPATRAILIMPALVQSLVFGYVATFDLNDAPMVVMDHSRSAASAELIGRLEAGGVLRRIASVERQTDFADAINTQQATVGLQIGARFEEELLSGQPATVQLVADGRNSNSAGSALAYGGSVIAAFNRDWSARHGGTPMGVKLEQRAWFNPNLETRWNILPGMIAALSMLQTLLLSALSVAREREQGTFDQLLVTPMSPLEIMAGKALAPISVGLLQSTIILLVTRYWFDIPMAGSVLTLYTGLVLFTVASVGIGLAISAIALNMQQAMLYTFVLVMPLMLLSGLTTPVENMPAFMQGLTMANPLRYAVDLVRRVYLEGVGIGAVTADLLPLILIAAITLPLASWMFRNRLA
jgi:ABC-2 type transport system permease protein